MYTVQAYADARLTQVGRSAQLSAVSNINDERVSKGESTGWGGGVGGVRGVRHYIRSIVKIPLV